MSEMIERMALVMSKLDPPEFDRGDNKGGWEALARVALETARAMPDKYLQIGVGYTDFSLPDETHDNTPDGWLREFRMAWITAIDAALNEKEGS